MGWERLERSRRVALSMRMSETNRMIKDSEANERWSVFKVVFQKFKNFEIHSQIYAYL